MPSTQTIVLTSVGLVATIGVGYAIYFDHKRRTDPEFRREIRRGARLLEKKRRREEDNARANSRKAYQQAWEELKEETFPTRPDEMEQFFMTQISRGEQLSAQGPPAFLEAAKHFSRGLKVYPNTAELMDIYKKTVPEAVFEMISGIRDVEEDEKKGSLGMD